MLDNGRHAIIGRMDATAARVWPRVWPRFWPIVTIALLVPGCWPAAQPEICSADCRLIVELPEDPAMPPQLPPILHAVGGQVLNLDLRGSRPGQARTVIAFDDRPFEDESGVAIHSLELEPGHNHFRLRGFEAGVCHAPAGCRYFVVNFGLRARPPATGNSGVLIIEPATGTDRNTSPARP